MFERVKNLLGIQPVKRDYSNEGAVATLMSKWTQGDSPRVDASNMATYLGKYADQAWIYSCIKVIQTKAAGVPLNVYKRIGDEDVEQKDHPLKKLLDGANPFMSGYDLREATHGFVELVGNSYWLKDKVVNGIPNELYPLNPKCIKIKADKSMFITGYEYQLVPGMTQQTFKPEEILHFKTWNPLDPFYGLAPICAARDSSDMMMFSDQYNKAFFRNGAEPGGYLTSEQGLEEDEKKRITSIWNKLHRGARKAFGVAILDGGLKFTSSSTSHKDMMFGELKRMTREDVLTVFNMPPIMVGVFDEANYSNAQEQRKIFWVDCIIPRLRKIEGVINERLAPDYGDVFVKHDLSGIEDLAEDAGERARTDSYNVTAGIQTVNEIRKLKNLPDVPWGDTWYAPMGLAPVVLPGEEPAPEPTPAPPAPGEPEGDEPVAPKGKQKDAAPEPEPVVDENVVRRDAIWQKYKGLTETHEKKWAPVMRSNFNEQEREVIHNLRDSDWQKTVNQNRLDKMRNVKISLDVILFDRVKARTTFRKDGHRLMKDTVQASGDKEVKDYGLGIDFNVNNPEVTAWINSKAFKFAEEINRTTEDSLRAELTEAIANGETLTQVEERVARVFDIARGSRTAMIARTEVISASNEGAVASYKQSGLVDKTEWITSRDNRVRDEHQIDGEQVDLGHKFSNGLEYPGDPSGEPGNVINCRCTVAPIVKKGE